MCEYRSCEEIAEVDLKEILVSAVWRRVREGRKKKMEDEPIKKVVNDEDDWGI